jgi:hypothetical protein
MATSRAQRRQVGGGGVQVNYPFNFHSSGGG